MRIRQVAKKGLRVSYSLVVFLSFILASPSYSAIYKYKDENGKTHFTDDASKIPAKYRKKDQLKTMESGPEDPSAPVKLNFPERQAFGGAIPVQPYGNGHFLVEATLNGRIKVKLMVDTGASMVVLSERVGKLLKVSGNKKLPTIKVSTAGGKVESPLFFLESIKIGKAREFIVEATTNPHFKDKNVDGLLGMTFLGEFKLEMDRTNNKMYLKPVAKKGEMTWGGHTEAWWRKRYNDYTGSMQKYRNWINNYMMIQKTRSNYGKMITHYSKMHAALEKRADQVRLPKEFRAYP